MNTVQSSGGGQAVKGKDPGLEELVAVTPNQRNWRGILIALLVIVAVLALIVFSIVLLSPPDDGARIKGERLSVKDALGPQLRAHRFNGSWVTETDLALMDTSGSVVLLSAENLTTREIVPHTTMKQYNADRFSVSADRRFVLLENRERKKIFKYSYETRYYIFDVTTQKSDIVSLTKRGEGAALQLVTWAPVGSAFAFVHANNIFFRAQAWGLTYQVTHSGRPGVVFNGVPDSLYEEELLHAREALWFSPDGRHLLFATFNDSVVDELRFPWYGAAGGGGPYPEVRSLRYARAGRPNPIATLWAVDVSEPQTLRLVDMKPPPEVLTHLDNGEHYVTGVRWAPLAAGATAAQREAVVVWTNRRQNLTVISLCRASSGVCVTVHEEHAGAGAGEQVTEDVEEVAWAWGEAPATPPIAGPGVPGTRDLAAVLRVRDGEQGSFPHACLVRTGEHNQLTPLTHGPFEVTRLLYWDHDAHFLYFQATVHGLPGQRHLYRVNDGLGNETKRGWEVLTWENSTRATAPLPTSDGGSETSEAPPAAVAPEWLGHCGWSEATFAPGGAFAVVECLGPDVPTDTLVAVTPVGLTPLTVLDTRPLLRERWGNISQPQKKELAIDLPGGFRAQVRLLLPQGLREEEEVVFPLVLYMEGAVPGGQLVTERWHVDWGTSLASRCNYIVARVDARGSGFQGDAMRHALRRKLGGADVEDQLTVIASVRKSYKYVDSKRVAVVGRGAYGGFVAAMVLAQDPPAKGHAHSSAGSPPSPPANGYFRCGAAVTPVASWAEHASAFSERFLGSPNLTDNYRGYDEADVSKRAGNLKGKHFLLAHGTADGSAPFRQSMLFARALAQEGVIFRQLAYPDEGHDLLGVQVHLYKSLEAFLKDCLEPLDFTEWESGGSYFNF